MVKGYSVPRDFSWIENYKLNVLDLPSISPQSAISGFLDEVLEHKHLLNHVLPIFKNYFYKARESKDLNFNILKNYLTKIRDLKTDLKGNDKYSKKWTVISSILCFTKN